MDQPILRARALSKSYGSVVALDALDLSVASGDIVCLLGANGAGKTTALNLFLGFAAPTSGEALIAERSATVDGLAARSALGYLPEVVSIYPLLTGAENIAFFGELTGNPASATERDAILGRLRFPEEALNRRAATYSKGMRQKIGLAIALLKGAQAILLDEPLSGLDPAAANDLVGILRELAGDGLAVLATTHDVFRARDMATRVGILRHGRLVELIDPAGLTGSQLESLYLTHMAERATA